MADKKISQLTERITAILGTDLLPLVANNAGTLTNYRVQVKNLLGNVSVDLPTINASGIGLSATVPVNCPTALLAAAQFTLLSGNAASNVSANTYGTLITHSYPSGAGKRGVAPRAFIGMLDAPGANGAATTYLLDIGAQGNTVSSNVTAANTSVMLTVPTGARAATHLVKVCINGTDMWLLAANTVTGV